MARTAGSTGEKTSGAILRAALKLFSRHGYAAVSMRAIASAVGIQVGALYNHFSTKQDVLASVMTGHMDELLAAWEEEKLTHATPICQLEGFVRFHVRYHMTRHEEVFTSFMELRSLEPDNFAEVEARRKTYEYDVRNMLEAGRKSGDFIIDDAHVNAMALIAMLTGVTNWFKPDGRLSVDEIEEIYVQLAFRAVGLSGSAADRSGASSNSLREVS